MNAASRLSRIFTLLGTALIAAALLLSFLCLDAPVRVLAVPEGARQRTDELMAAICRKEYPLAASMLLGQPELDVSSPEDPLEKALWEAYQGSLSYSFPGGLSAAEEGLVREVTVTCLDIPALLESLKVRASGALAAKAAQLEDAAVYNAEGGYQEAFVSQALAEEVGRILESGTYSTEKTLRLSLVSRDGQWWVVPDDAVLDLLAGGMGK